MNSMPNILQGFYFLIPVKNKLLVMIWKWFGKELWSKTIGQRIVVNFYGEETFIHYLDVYTWNLYLVRAPYHPPAGIAEGEDLTGKTRATTLLTLVFG